MHITQRHHSGPVHSHEVFQPVSTRLQLKPDATPNPVFSLPLTPRGSDGDEEANTAWPQKSRGPTAAGEGTAVRLEDSLDVTSVTDPTLRKHSPHSRQVSIRLKGITVEESDDTNAPPSRRVHVQDSTAGSSVDVDSDEPVYVHMHLSTPTQHTDHISSMAISGPP
jgi:hypothetical protein